MYKVVPLNKSPHLCICELKKN